MFFPLIFVVLILLIVGIAFYYSKIIKRISSIFKKDIGKRKVILVLLSIMLCLLSVNFFSIVGLFLMHFIVISLIIDLLYLIVKRFIKKEWITNIYKSCLIPLLLAIIVLGYGFFNIRNIIETKYTIYTDKEIGEDLRILFISDSHYGEILKKDGLDEVKKRLDKVDADIVILGGDIVDESTSNADMKYIFKVFGNIKNKYGIYYVYGNHDKQQYRVDTNYSKEELDKAILDNNIKILKDSYIALNDNITLIGREDYSFERKDISDIIDGVDKNAYLIMVDHQPVKYAENMENDIDLIMSGHTHGGQIFPIELFIKLLHTADLSYGYERVGEMDAIVSSGMVGWGYPIRTSKHSEYVIIDVKEK